ncbi:MAG: UbiH/UbiF/VisC/COQ6 family ubiquinone biosynthesis hydroxylase [Gammaproteobacteria bacterium]
MKMRYDVVVVGGGMVGAAAACGLAQGGVNVALLETRTPERRFSPEPPDIRVSALTRASQNILENLGAWSGMVERGVSPYREMRVWDAAAGGELHFDCADTEFGELGHIVENRVTVASLWDVFESIPGVSVVCPARLEKMSLEENCRRLWLDDGQVLEAELVIAADGRDSAVRGLAGIGVAGWPYRQDGLVANVLTEKSHRMTAWQRFLEEGPLAFLPLKNGQCSIVWTLTSETARNYLNLSERDFLQVLEEGSSGILGGMLSVGPRATFPLRFQFAERYTDARLALIGDAAHAMHPLAGQGANAGLLDAAAIAELTIQGVKEGRPIASRHMLRRYERWRKGDNLAMQGSMDLLKRVYGVTNEVFAGLRSAGMNRVNRSALLKGFFNRYAMGLRDDLPSQARGSNRA